VVPRSTTFKIGELMPFLQSRGDRELAHMGLAFSTASFLLDAYQRGANFKSTLTLGRVQLYLLPRELERLRRLAGHELSQLALQTKFGGFADAFLTSLLSIETLEALDYSAYQGASIMHDMNQPIPSELEGRFDAVIDSGTIEHVFNFPVAMANCMKMVRLGGRLFIITVANNHCGHGFYQFSPELFFRLFKNQNGFHLERLLLLTHPFPGLELSSAQHLYTVKDPDEMRYRVGLVNHSPVMLLLEAERRSVEEVLATPPQQSDYATIWKRRQDTGDSAVDNPLPHRFMQWLRHRYYAVPEHFMPALVKNIARWTAGLYQRHILYSIRNRKFYRPTRPLLAHRRKNR
jgi:SAM-dependent methyltransferase